MATLIFSQDAITDMEQLKSLSTHVVGVLDREAGMDSMKVLLTDSNISDLNDLYTTIIEKMQAILNSPEG